MPKTQKTVRFYDTVLIDKDDVHHAVQSDFWPGILDRLARWDLPARSDKVFGVDYFGRSVSPRRPALPHLQIERIRDLAERLNRSNVANGDVRPLGFADPNDRVSEPTYVVPFGQHGRVAVMSPAVQGTRSETISRWLTAVLGLVKAGYSLELVPVVDPDVLQRILNAEGAVMLEVHVDAGAAIPSTGGGAVGDAFRNAQQQALDDTRMVLRWSLGRSGGNSSVRETLRQGALWVVENIFTSKAKVKLADIDGDGKLVRDEERSIFKDRITKKVSFDTTAGQRASDEDILTAVGDAIKEFNKGGSSIGLRDTGTIDVASIDLDAIAES